jgi:hypothetical protein
MSVKSVQFRLAIRTKSDLALETLPSIVPVSLEVEAITFEELSRVCEAMACHKTHHITSSLPYSITASLHQPLSFSLGLSFSLSLSLFPPFSTSLSSRTTNHTHRTSLFRPTPGGGKEHRKSNFQLDLRAS